MNARIYAAYLLSTAALDALDAAAEKEATDELETVIDTLEHIADVLEELAGDIEE